MCIEDTFAPLLQSCSSLVAAGADTNKKTDEILGQVQLTDSTVEASRRTIYPRQEQVIESYEMIHYINVLSVTTGCAR